MTNSRQLSLDNIILGPNAKAKKFCNPAYHHCPLKSPLCPRIFFSHIWNTVCQRINQASLRKIEVTLGFPGRKGFNTGIRSYTIIEHNRAMKSREVNTAVLNLKNKSNGSQNGHQEVAVNLKSLWKFATNYLGGLHIRVVN